MKKLIKSLSLSTLLLFVFLVMSSSQITLDNNKRLDQVTPPGPVYSIGYFTSVSGYCKTFTRCSTGYTFNVSTSKTVYTGRLYKLSLEGFNMCHIAINVQPWDECDF